MIVSADGERLFVSGVGDTMYVYDAETLEPETQIFAGGDFMIPAATDPLPRRRELSSDRRESPHDPSSCVKAAH